MRIVLLTQYFVPEPGAPQSRLAGMVRELARRGHVIEVVTCFPNYPVGEIYPEFRGRLYRSEQWEDIHIHRTWLYAANGAGLKRYLNYISFAATSVIGLLRAEKPDLMIVESPPLPVAVIGLIAGRIWGVPTVLNISDLWPDSAVDFGLLRPGFQLSLLQRVEAWAYRQASFVSAVTQGIKGRLINEKGLSTSKLLFLPNGVDTDMLSPLQPDEELKRKLGLQGKNIVLYAGTTGYAHGADTLIRAASLLSDTNVHFLFLGGGSLQGQLEQLARKHEVENVTFLPPVPVQDVRRFFSIAYCGLASVRNCSITAGAIPAKMLAVMACGKPVVYSGDGEGARMAERARAGIVVPDAEPKALADGIRQLLADPSKAVSCGRAGREYVENHLTWSTLIENWLGQLNHFGWKVSNS
jgi:colanic acid biosynthesis glycosyl transferase WcaI